MDSQEEKRTRERVARRSTGRKIKKKRKSERQVRGARARAKVTEAS